MNRMRIRVLLIEDSQEEACMIRERLAEAVEFECDVEHVARLGDGLERLDGETFDIVLLDHRLPDSVGLATLVKARKHAPAIPIVLLAGRDDHKLALEALEHGAQDYLFIGHPDRAMLTRSILLAIQRKRADEAQRESEGRFHSVAESAIDAIMLTDSSGTIRYWNKAAEQIFGYREEQAVGMSLSRLITLAPLEEGEGETESRSLQIGELEDLIGINVKTRGVRHNGELFPLELSLASWMSGGERSFSATVRDLTEIREAQQRARRQDRMAAAGQLAAGVAHEFNNTMAAVILYTEMVLSSLELSAKNQERMRTILSQAQRSVVLTRQILDLNRQAVPELKPMDLVPFMEELQKLLRRSLPESIDVDINCVQSSYVINGDPASLQQVFMNLARNSRGAMEQGGTLHFEIDDIVVAHDLPPSNGGGIPHGKWIRIKTSDTGVGIPHNVLPRVFEPFFTTKPPGEGAGLGLAQVFGIVRQHKGHIDIVSREGEGTDVTLFLPVTNEVAALGPIPNAVIPERGRDGTVLVVEDDTPTLNAVGEILKSLDYQVLLAEDGRKARNIIERNSERIDAVLTDLVMPEMGGVELLYWLREVHPEIALVLMTGYPLGEDTHKLLEQETVTWIQKPLRPDSLARTLREVMLRVSSDAPPVRGEARRRPEQGERDLPPNLKLAPGAGAPNSDSRDIEKPDT